ncbi:EF-hand domain-containing protein [Psychroserpens mesophilus]|uniref:hypothetical protein n=1 Tax=Psychroserpens mesophilus TaxID=325473 RepID=UPI00058BC622|nr:hypothetical protein [Psychroserpens mesophilus]
MKSSLFKTLVIVFGMTICMSTSSYAQANGKVHKKPPTFEQLLKEMDANEDSKLSKDEVKGPLKDEFDKVDTDEDGFITEEEFKKAPKPKRKERN